MLPSELMKKIRRLEIRTNRVVEEVIGGAYHSVFKGRGIEFDEVREYTEADDVRDIDWNVTARMGAPYIKKYIEERELNVLLAVDVSGSGAFGSGPQTKRETAAELAALLAFSAGSNGDKVGLLLFSDQLELYLPPRSGRRHTLRLIRELLAFDPRSKGTDLALALSEIRHLLTKRSVVFLLSDFLGGGDYETQLKIVNRRHDVVGVRILDPAEIAWPLAAGLELCDAESGAVLSFAGGRRRLARWREVATAEYARPRATLERAQVDLIEVHCGEDPLRPLIGFFNRRRRQIRA